MMIIMWFLNDDDVKLLYIYGIIYLKDKKL